MHFLLRTAQSETFECRHVLPEQGLFERHARTLARCSYIHFSQREVSFMAG